MLSTDIILEHASGFRFPSCVLVTPSYLDAASSAPIEVPTGVDLIIATGGSESERAIPALSRTGIPVAYTYSVAEKTESRRELSRQLASGTVVRLLDEGEGIRVRGFEFVGVESSGISTRPNPTPARFQTKAKRSSAPHETLASEQGECCQSGNRHTKAHTSALPESAFPAEEAEQETIATICVGDPDSEASSQAIVDRLASSLDEIGKRLQYRQRVTGQELSPRLSIVQTPFVHIHADGASLPVQEALYPLTPNTEQNLLVESIHAALAASDAGVLHPVSLADAYFSVREQAGCDDKDAHNRIIFPCDELSRWFNAVNDLRYELVADGLNFVIEGFPLDRLVADKLIVIGVFVEGVNDGQAAELQGSLYKTVGRKHGASLRFFVTAHPNLSEIRHLVNALSDEALEVVASLSNN